LITAESVRGTFADSEGLRLVVSIALSLFLHAIFVIALARSTGDSAGNGGRTGNALVVLKANLAVSQVADDASSPIVDEVDSRQHLAVPRKSSKQYLEQPESSGEIADGSSTYYWPYDRLDELPQVLEDVDLNTPDIYALTRSGKVFVTLLINVNGYVDEVQVENEDSQPEMQNLRHMLIEHFQAAKFSPGKLGGREVAVSLPITVNILP
jgi:hypothetical protein